MSKEIKSAAKLILNKISKDAGLPVEQLQLINIHESQIIAALRQCRDSGLSINKSIKMVVHLWNSANPEQNTYASEKEMILMGFVDGTDKTTKKWVHLKTGLIITDEQRMKLSFREVEQLVLAEMNHN